MPEGLITGLKHDAGGHINEHSYGLVKTINAEIGRIESIKQRQAALFVTINSAITAVLFTFGIWAVENEYWPSWLQVPGALDGGLGDDAGSY